MKTLSLIVVSVFAVSICHGFELHPSERLLRNERRHQKDIVSGILFLQQAVGEKTGRNLRGTHAKGVCSQAELVIPAHENARLSQGLFAHPGTYPAVVRFANADGGILPDQEPDVRSLSFAVELPPSISNPQGRMDFSTNNATTFPINDAEVFASLMILAQKGTVKGGAEIGPRRFLSVSRALYLGNQQKSRAERPYQMMRYWSGVPFAYGPTEVVKYSLKPCAQNLGRLLTSDPDTLSKELVRHLNEDPTPSCFELQVQFLDVKSMAGSWRNTYSAYKWVENATWEWPEHQAPFQTVARLQLKTRGILNAQECEGLRFNVNKNTTSEHRGLGSINRARTQAEEASGANR